MAGYRRGLRLPGSVVVVTGAADPVGAATAGALARRGARPVLLGPPGGALDRAAAACRAPAFGLDAADPDAVRDTVRDVARRLGRVDGWVQTAPLAPAASGALVDLPPVAVGGVVGGAVREALAGARAALPLMSAGGGVFVVVASLHAQVARPFAAAPGMAGAALRVMAAALRQELRLTGVRGVAVTTVLVPEQPGTDPVRVAATVLGRLRHPGLEKVAGGPLATALVHGHALVPPVSEWLVARWSGRRAAPDPAGGGPPVVGVPAGG